ncbi:MAG: VWA domain-containing protein [Vicinamibacteria bacterium]|nr:VWA domain-containing protein [Vicinamibacteria bacterium]
MKLFDIRCAFGAAWMVGAALLVSAQDAPPPPQPTATPAAGTPAIVFPAAVELVTVDAVVTDKKNVPIESLTRDQFQVFEDGKLQNIASFEAVVLPASPHEGPRKTRTISTNQGAETRTGRTFIIVFDDVHLHPFQANRAKAAIDQFLKNGTRDGDRVTLLASGGGAWWSTRMPEGYRELTALLKRLDGRDIPDIGQDRVTEWESMRIHIYRDKQVEERVTRRFETYGINNPASRSQQETGFGFDGDPLVQGRASEVYYQATAKNKITLNAVERALSSLAGSKGRKSLILVGQGFIFDPNLDEFKDVVQASRRGNCAIYFVDTTGLGGMPSQMTAQFGPAMPTEDIGAAFAENLERSEGAESISADSGGFSVKNSNDLVKGLQRIADETRVYYLIGYNPANTARDGKFRKIEVKVAGKDMRVRARKGYFAAIDGDEAIAKAAKKKAEGGPDPQFQEALDSPFEMPDIPIRMTSYVFDETLLGKASAILHADIDLSAFALIENEGRFTDTLDFLLVVAHRETGEFNRYDQKIEMNLRPETKSRYAKSWFPIQRDFELLPGAYQAKIVVRDKNSSKIGTVIHDFEVPDLAALRISTPVLTDTTQPVAPGQENAPPKLVLLARRDFVTGSRLFCQFDVYNPTKDKATGMPKVTAGYTIRRKKDGMVFLKVAPTMIQPTSLGRLSRMVGPPLEGAEPGEYEFELYLKDELSGRILDFKEDITVLPAPAAAASPLK